MFDAHVTRVKVNSYNIHKTQHAFHWLISLFCTTFDQASEEVMEVIFKRETTRVSDGYVLALGDQNTFWPFFFLSPDFHELWHSVMSVCSLS